jgi:hypothetical protein
MSGLCDNCKCFRTRLEKCAECLKKLCGCCSLRSPRFKKRLCCYPGDDGCIEKVIARIREVI